MDHNHTTRERSFGLQPRAFSGSIAAYQIPRSASTASINNMEVLAEWMKGELQMVWLKDVHPRRQSRVGKFERGRKG
jgi:hypothetical protein